MSMEAKSASLVLAATWASRALTGLMGRRGRAQDLQVVELEVLVCVADGVEDPFEKPQMAQPVRFGLGTKRTFGSST